MCSMWGGGENEGKSLLRRCLSSPSSSHLVDLVSALGQLAASNLESWSLAVPHTMDEGETVADCITVLCLPSLLGGNEIVAMEKWVEPWCTLLRFMKKMAASGMSGAEQIVFDSKVANTVCSLVLNSQRSQLKEMFMHIFDIVSLSLFNAHNFLTQPALMLNPATSLLRALILALRDHGLVLHTSCTVRGETLAFKMCVCACC